MRPPAVAASVLVSAAVLTAGWHVGAQAGQAPLPGVHVIAAPPAAASGSGSTPGSKRSKNSRHRSRTTKATSGGSKNPTKAASPGSSRRLQDGAVVATPYGDVQVAVVVVGHRITDIQALRLTDANGHSRQISADAAPILRSEALTAQNARIDTVSGATYTSEGYKQSLQAALDQAHL